MDCVADAAAELNEDDEEEEEDARAPKMGCAPPAPTASGAGANRPALAACVGEQMP
jgi:hypothetical protein